MMDVAREKLVREYYAAVKAYSEAVRRLSNDGDFADAYQRVEEMRATCEACRAALLQFEKESAS